MDFATVNEQRLSMETPPAGVIPHAAVAPATESQHATYCLPRRNLKSLVGKCDHVVDWLRLTNGQSHINIEPSRILNDWEQEEEHHDGNENRQYDICSHLFGLDHLLDVLTREGVLIAVNLRYWRAQKKLNA